MMKYVFNEYAQHLPFKIKEQIRELNGKVIGIIVPSIMINLESYILYLEDSTTQPKQLELPINVSSSGNKILPSTSTVNPSGYPSLLSNLKNKSLWTFLFSSFVNWYKNVLYVEEQMNPMATIQQ